MRLDSNLLSMKKPILQFALAILLFPLLGSSAAVEDRNEPKVFVQFLPEKGEYAGIPLATELRQADSLPAGEYRTKAKVTLTTEKVSEVIDSRVLEWRAPARRIDGASEWLEKGGAWIWTPARESVPLGFPFAATQGDDRDINLADFDELWRTLPSGPRRLLPYLRGNERGSKERKDQRRKATFKFRRCRDQRSAIAVLSIVSPTPTGSRRIISTWQSVLVWALTRTGAISRMAASLSSAVPSRPPERQALDLLFARCAVGRSIFG